MAFTVALLGAECTGKTTLAKQLVDGLRAAQLGPVALASESLRGWCQAHGRTPEAPEQAHIAQLQAQAMAKAQQQVGPSGWVVADTTPLQTAAYSHAYFASDALDEHAAAHHSQQVQLTLLMGLDLPWQADGFLRDGPALQTRTDQHLRHVLHMHRLPHQVVYGTGPAREGSAWLALAAHPSMQKTAQLAFKTIAEKLMEKSGRFPKNVPFMPMCEHCDNAECEHRLFTRLTAGRRSPGEMPPAA